MAFAISVIVFLAVSGVYIIPVHGNTCPPAWDGSVGFDCPRIFDSVDEWYCCDAGETSQYCCDFNDYYNYGYLSTGVIVGVVVGCTILFVLFVTSIIACCVCCARAPPRYPVSTHIHTTTIATPTERPAPIMTVNAPPGYYTPSAQAAPPPPRALKESKPGQYQQFQNEPVYPNN